MSQAITSGMLVEFLDARPGRCPTCDYSLAGLASDHCPECGLNLQLTAVPCPLCGYNLRGLKGNRCPECGNTLALRVGLAEPAQAAFIAGIVGICLPLGFVALLLVWVSLMAFLRPGGMPPTRDLIPLVAGLPVGAIILWQWLRRRPALMRLANSRRWWWAGAATVVGLICPLWFMIVVR